MPRLINILTGTSQECDFIRYQLDENIKIEVEQITKILKSIDNGIQGSHLDGTNLIDDQVNLNQYRRIQLSADAMAVMLNLLYVCLTDLIRLSGKHRINGYFWYITEKYPDFEVISLTNDPTNNDDIPVVYCFETRELQIKFSVNNAGIEYPTTGKLLY